MSTDVLFTQYCDEFSNYWDAPVDNSAEVVQRYLDALDDAEE